MSQKLNLNPGAMDHSRLGPDPIRPDRRLGRPICNSNLLRRSGELFTPIRLIRARIYRNAP